MRRRSIARAVRVGGVGLHGGQPVTAELRPAPPGAGRAFVVGGARIPATLAAVDDAHLATRLAAGGASVRTVEHLLAAAFALDLDDLEVAVSGDELPVLDGSAAGWLEALDRAGPVETDGAPTWFPVEQPVSVRQGLRQAHMGPADHLTIDARIDFAHPAIGAQSLAVAHSAARFRDEVAPARTFGFERDVVALRAAGFARGGSLDNAVVFSEEGVLNPGGLRFDDEPVRHKVLDLYGDLALLGGRLRARVTVDRPGHALTHALLRAAVAARAAQAPA